MILTDISIFQQNNTGLLAESRARLVTHFYGVLAIGLTLSITLQLINNVVNSIELNRNAFIFALILVASMWLMFLRPQTLKNKRSFIFLSMLYLASLVILAQEGLVSNGRTTLIIWMLLVYLIGGLRNGIAGTIITCLTILSIGIAQSNGSFNELVSPEQIDLLVSPRQGIRISISFTFSVGITSYAIYYLQREIQQSYAEQQLLLSELQAEARLQENRVQKRREALTISTNIGYRISNILDENELIHLTLQETQYNRLFDLIQLYLWDKGGKTLQWQSGLTQDLNVSPPHALTITDQDSPLYQVCKMKQSMHTPSIPKENDWAHLRPNMQAEITVPIRSQGEVLGVVNVQQTQSGSLTQNDLFLLETVANQLGVAINNARRYALEQRKIQQGQWLTEVNQAIQDADTFEEVLETAASAIGEFTKSSKVHINLGLKNDRPVK